MLGVFFEEDLPVAEPENLEIMTQD